MPFQNAPYLEHFRVRVPGTATSLTLAGLLPHQTNHMRLGASVRLVLLQSYLVLTTALWPAPRYALNGTATVFLTPSKDFFTAKGAAGALLQAAFARYAALTFPHQVTTEGLLTALHINVEDTDESHPQLQTDESYTLNVSTRSAATLHAKTVYGALRGLETFSQLVVFDFETETYTIPNCPWAVSDSPRFPHRGLMIDTARHFLPLASIRAIVDSLPYAKMNVLHWHLVDSQAFPFHSETNPKLWHGAYDGASRYTHADVASIVEYARVRGVRVMPEFDTPGHAQSWCVGYPELCPSKLCTTPLDVSKNATFDLLERLFGECTGKQPSARGKPSGLFPDAFFHLGGDEVSTSCWTLTPHVNAWLKEHGMSADDGYAYFVKRTAQIAQSQGRRPVQWSEVFDHFKKRLPKEIIVHVWKSVTNVTEVVADGYDVLRNVGYNTQSWYLDNLNVDWQHVYSNDPCAGVPDSLCHKVLGGHGEMWGETVDASDLQQTIWPRLAAISEKLWSPRAKTADATSALSRLEEFRCGVLNARGIAAAPVRNKDARSAPSGPGACRTQR